MTIVGDSEYLIPMNFGYVRYAYKFRQNSRSCEPTYRCCALWPSMNRFSIDGMKKLYKPCDEKDAKYDTGGTVHLRRVTQNAHNGNSVWT